MSVQHTASGVGAPIAAPPSIGAHYTDTSNGDQYLAKGTSSPADWVLQGGAGGKKVVELVAGTTVLNLSRANVFLAAAEGGDVVIPLQSSVNFPGGTEIEIGQIGDSVVTVSAVDGVTVIQKKSTRLKTSGFGTMLRLKMLAADTWLATGDLVPLTYLAGLTWGDKFSSDDEMYGPIRSVPELNLLLTTGMNSSGTAGGYYWSSDNGATWNAPVSVPAGKAPSRLVWSPQLGALVGSVGVTSDGTMTEQSTDMVAIKLIKSVDGKTWSLSDPLTTNSAFYDNNVLNCLGIDPATGKGQILCRYTGATTDPVAPAKTYSLVTADGGATWTEVIHELTGANDMTSPCPLMVWSEVMQGFLGVSYNGDVWVSTTPGQWAVQGSTGGQYNGDQHFAEDPASGVMLLSLGSGVVLRSADSGQTWATIQAAPAASSSRICNLHLSASGFLAADLSASYIHSSVDGLTWRNIATPDSARCSGIVQIGSSTKYLAMEDYWSSTTSFNSATAILAPLE